MKEFKGEFIREVWDFRLSSATPLINNSGETWVVEIWAKNNPDYDPEKPDEIAKPLEVYDTGIKSEVNDAWDCEKIKKCYEWLYSIRDNYSLDHIELRKPLVKMINVANSLACEINAKAEKVKTKKDLALYNQFKGELQNHLSVSNNIIKAATKVFHDQVAKIGGGA